MRKRRRLANKMIIMVCAVLIAVSAFFYAPMEVSAEESVVLNTSVDYLTRNRYICEGKGLTDSVRFDFSPYLSGSGLYKVSVDFTAHYQCVTTITSEYCYWRNVHTVINTFDSAYDVPSNSSTHMRDFQYSENGLTLYIDSENPIVDVTYYFTAVFVYDVGSSINFAMGYDFSNISVEKITAEDSSDYQDGYNAGYSAGESAGYGNGYSQGFTDGEASVDTDAIYDEAFQAGKDSVDTQSYYDAGYQAGYQVAYSEGYESGYDVGYQDALDRIANWGADTNDYPLLILDYPLASRVFSIVVKSSIPTQYNAYGERTVSVSFNPNHTYRFDLVLNPTRYEESSADIYFMETDSFYLNVGGIKFRLSTFDGADVNSFFVPGDCVSNAFGFSWEPYLAVMGDTFESGTATCYYDLTFQIYDMGPSGDTQNHIANQTDQLTNGYDDSKGNSVNSELSTGLNEFETAENSLFATATTGMKDFTFFDFESVPAMLTAVTFITSIMGSWFEQAGGASGVGIVLSILFSVMLVSMVLGLYRLYQSAGHRSEARERHRERMEHWKRGK